MRVTVKQKHINEGIKGDSCRCPLARALVEKCPDKIVSVLYAHAYLRLPEETESPWLLSHRAQKFVVDFDDGKAVKPATFILKPH